MDNIGVGKRKKMEAGDQLNTEEYIKLGLIHSIHTSERKAFRACRRRWDWAYRQDYHPVVTPKPLEFGIAWHVAKQTWYDPDSWRADREMVAALTMATFMKTVNDQLKRYKELNGHPSDEVIKDYKERVDLGVQMLKYYTQKVSPKLDGNLTPLAVEIPFEVPLDFNCKCNACWDKFVIWSKEESHGKFVGNNGLTYNLNNFAPELNKFGGELWQFWLGLPVTFGGRIDAIFQDDIGRLLVVDWKSTARILDDVDEAAFLQLDDQVGGYVAALYKLGRPADGFIYHEQRKAVPTKPEKLSRAYKGKLYSTNKAGAYEYDSYVKEVMVNDEFAYRYGLYDEFIQFLKGPNAPKFYQRHTIYKTQIQLENFWNDLILEAKDILGNPRIYPQASRFSCNSCMYRQPCEGQNRGEDYKYTLDSMFIRDRA